MLIKFNSFDKVILFYKILFHLVDKANSFGRQNRIGYWFHSTHQMAFSPKVDMAWSILVIHDTQVRT